MSQTISPRKFLSSNEIELNRLAHNRATKALFPSLSKDLIDSVNKRIDSSAKTLGPRHREGIEHTLLGAALLGATEARRRGRPANEGVKAALAHLAEDRLSDRMTKVRITKNLSLKKLFDALS